MGSPRHHIELTAGATVLVLAPHPDDFDAIGVTMRLLAERGHSIHLAVATSGVSGVDDEDCAPPTVQAKAALREREQRESCRFFGLPDERLRFLRLEADSAGHPIAAGANEHTVRRLLAELTPSAVFHPHGHDTNVAHQRIDAIVRCVASPTVTVYGNRDPKTIAMRYDVVTPYDDVQAVWKGSLLRLHRSQQLRNLRRRGQGLDERILMTDRASAATCGLTAPYAEVFEVWTSRTP